MKKEINKNIEKSFNLIKEKIKNPNMIELEILKDLSKNYPNDSDFGYQLRIIDDEQLSIFCKKYSNDRELGNEMRKLLK